MQVNYDRFAILLSGLCAVHCLAVPIVAGLFPLLSATLNHGHEIHELWFHKLILFFVLPVSIVALTTGYSRHRTWLPIWISSIGMIILAIPALFFETLLSNQLISHESEILFTLTGGIIHAIGHIMNVQATRQCH